MLVPSLMRLVAPDARASATNGSTKCAYVSGITPSAELGKRLAVFTGMNGCSAHQNDSKPRCSAVRAMNAGSTRYAGSGIETPMFMASVRKMNRGGETTLVADDARRVALAREVFRERHVPGAEAMLGAILEADLHFALERDDVLPARRVVPVVEVTGLRRAEHDALRPVQRRQIRPRGGIHFFDVRSTVGARVQPRHAHDSVSFALRGRRQRMAPDRRSAAICSVS